jgi:CAAX protease family protein
MRRDAYANRGIAKALVVLATTNLLNNRLLPPAYVVTGVAGSGVLIGIARRDGFSGDELGLARRSVPSGLRWGAGAVALVFLGYTAAAATPATRTAFEDNRVTGASRADIAKHALVRVPLGTVLLEEAGFRGVLDAMLRRQYPHGRATAISALLFGIWHVLPARDVRASNAAVGGLLRAGWAGELMSVATVVAGTAAGGAVLSELRHRSQSLLAPAALHWALNGLGYVFARRAVGK